MVQNGGKNIVSYSFYKILHLTGAFAVVASLCSMVFYSLQGDVKAHPLRIPMTILHGVGMLFLLVAGFGMIAKLGLGMHGLWFFAKLLIWLALGGALVLAKRKRELAKPLWVGVLVLAVFAAYFGIYKPM